MRIGIYDNNNNNSTSLLSNRTYIHYSLKPICDARDEQTNSAAELVHIYGMLKATLVDERNSGQNNKRRHIAKGVSQRQL